MNLGPNFTLEELSRSEVALRKGIDNTAPPEAVDNLTRLVTILLEPARVLLGPLHINSGYRSPAVNAAVGGSPVSAHMQGRAADCVNVMGRLQDAFDALRVANLPIDQCIIECGAWLHLAIAAAGIAPRGEFLTASGGPGAWVYTRVG